MMMSRGRTHVLCQGRRMQECLLLHIETRDQICERNGYRVFCKFNLFSKSVRKVAVHANQFITARCYA